MIPSALVAVVMGIIINELFDLYFPNLHVSGNHLVKLPIANTFTDFIGQFSFPNFESITNPDVWITAITIAMVASIETLLCIEAGDKLDPLKRYSNGNTELKAQGVGNILAGFIGGIPLTSVIVRTSANINAGSRTKLSTLVHGFLLLLTVILIPNVLNKIPMATLAAILLMIGFKLSSPKVFRHLWAAGKFQFIPFLATVVGVVGLDLLKGVGIGLLVSIYFILRGNMKLAYFFNKEKHEEGEDIHILLAQEVSFLNKASIKQTLAHLPENSSVIISAKDTVYIDYDVLELIKDFTDFGSKDKKIKVVLEDFKEAYKITNTTNSHVF